MAQDDAERAASDRLVKTSAESTGQALDRLLEIMARLRAPDGCPWDREQTFETIAPYTIEEAYEVADAIEHGDMIDLADELGDLLLQVVYHARIAEERGAFAFKDVAEAISNKMVRRHPHVFDGAESFDWQAIKAAERAERAARYAAAGVEPEAPGILDGIPSALPSLMRAVKLQARAARVGFDWAEPETVLDKIAEESAEVVAAWRAAEAKTDATEAAKAKQAVSEEIGDLFFVLANLARKLDVDPEEATRAANAKFTRRFRSIEAALAAEGRSPEESSLAEMDALWDAAKRAEKEQG